MKQDDFYNQTLFMNIVLFCYYQRLPSCHNWKDKAIKELKHNIILKYPKENFGNVFVFIELLIRGCEDVNPIGFYYRSEDYFEKLLKLDILKDKLIFKRIFKKGRKCIR